MASSIVRRFMQTETEWNPKVMMGRIANRALPGWFIRLLKKHYYAYLVGHRPESWMEGDVAICAKLISPKENAIDIGASIGSFTRFMAKRARIVYAFEPMPQTYGYLAHNMKKLKLKNVRCLNFALSDADRKQTMVVPTYRWGDECHYDATIETPKSNPKWRRLQVQCQRLDSLTLTSIGFIKCDANGHELAVLRGAESTIKREHPAILIEVLRNPDDPRSTAAETFEFLASEGYSAFWFDGSILRKRERGDRSQNYFFLMPHHIERLMATCPEAASLRRPAQIEQPLEQAAAG